MRRSPEPLFNAFAQLVEAGLASRDQIRIRLIGHCRHVGGIPTTELARRYGLESIVSVEDSLPHAEALEIVRRSHLALLLAPGLPFQIPAKVYDYLGAGTRILAIAEDGGTSDLINETGCGSAFPSDDIDGIKAFLHRELTSPAPQAGRVASLNQLDVRRITRRLTEHLDRVDDARAAALRTASATFGD